MACSALTDLAYADVPVGLGGGAGFGSGHALLCSRADGFYLGFGAQQLRARYLGHHQGAVGAGQAAGGTVLGGGQAAAPGRDPGVPASLAYFGGDPTRMLGPQARRSQVLARACISSARCGNAPLSLPASVTSRALDFYIGTARFTLRRA